MLEKPYHHTSISNAVPTGTRKTTATQEDITLWMR